jgi:outer membrane biosynthesis protein TonB
MAAYKAGIRGRFAGDIDPDLARAAVEAVSQWRFRPTLLNGQPIGVVSTIAVRYTLSQ